ncbi:hypothetical protein [Vibrio sagamiensis]|uniref:Uncharacterized protein n=1 Tax=Vibrio sagamiensis NBRC 104589 TaxID=1219064 RepID=A0A511QFR4_9VIBR|nr:hypothetical protein [Vibrio sagamiensis]PNQ62652.1 hypothetical protein C1141_10485 [Vibrio agarivorans]GEM76153.1 hypothetical protein VSA01S_22650 [Vibrio sagamiensis NBRC 104589]
MKKRTKEYLTSMGWSSERMVELPEEYSAYSINDNVKSILRNIVSLCSNWLIAKHPIVNHNTWHFHYPLI